MDNSKRKLGLMQQTFIKAKNPNLDRLNLEITIESLKEIMKKPHKRKENPSIEL